MAFDYEAAKAQYGAQGAREREQQYNTAPPPPPPAPPAATTPPAPGAPPPPAPATPPKPMQTARPPAPAPAPAAPTAAQSSPYGDLSGFKDYNSWKAASGQDSSQIQNWYNQQMNPNAAPGAGTGGQHQAGGGTTPYTGPANTNEWQTSVGMTDGAHPDAAKPSGDPFVDSIRSGQHGSEDYARFSNAQLLAWRDKYVPGSNPPKFYNDFGDVVDKPTESGPKSQAAGYATGETDAGKASGGQGGPGGGGVGGGGGSSSMSASSTPGGGDMQEWWKNLIQKQGDSRYTPEAMAALEADQFSRARAQEKQQLQQSTADIAQRGVRGSASQNAARRQIGVGTGQQIMANRADLQKKKIDADYQDKQAAITNAQNYVNSMRDYMMRMEGNSIQREQIAAQIRLATQNINAQKDMMEQGYQNNLATMFAGG